MSEETPGVSRPIRILHVEDDPAHADLVRFGFAEHRLANEIRHVDTGPRALDYLFRRGEFEDPASSPLPDVVLLDLRLPGIDGLEVLQEIRAAEDEALKNLPVVILTTSEADRDRLKAYESLISGYVVKPFGFDSFASVLDVIYLVLKRPIRR